jgi:hypothetical protein
MPALFEPDLVLPAGSMVASHVRLGVSTGAYADLRGDWPALVARARGVSDAAVELGALSGPELPELISYLDEGSSLPFRFVSVHAPTKARIDSDAELARALGALPEMIDAVVLHPDTHADLSLFGELGWLAVIENMDARRHDGRTVAELEAIFAALPDARFCLDVAHAWTVDPTMRLAHDLLDAFKLRLSHVHVSSITEQCKHTPLTSEFEMLFAPVLARCIDVPWILEAV